MFLDLHSYWFNSSDNRVIFLYTDGLSLSLSLSLSFIAKGFSIFQLWTWKNYEIIWISKIVISQISLLTTDHSRD